MTTLQPTREDTFTVGLGTVGWSAADPFGTAPRAPVDVVEWVPRNLVVGHGDLLREAMAATPMPELRRPTLSADKTFEDLLADRSGFEDPDPDPAARRRAGVSRLDQLMVEHVLGAAEPDRSER